MSARHRFSHHHSSSGSWNKGSGHSSKDVDNLDASGDSFGDHFQPTVTSRDRTTEFQSVLKSFKSSQLKAGSRTKTVSPIQKRSEFSKYAKHIGEDLAKTYEKLEKLTLLCKKRTLFDDRPVEIQELTYIVKQDITSLKRQIQQLEENKENSMITSKKDVQKHNTSVVKTLRTKLAGMSENFKSVLEVRRENMKQQKLRKDQFSSSNLSSLMPTSSQGGSVLLMDEQRSSKSNSVSIRMDGSNDSATQQQSMQLLDQQDNYISERAETMETIESTIVELGSIFQQLATMVKEQEEQVMRIDSNVEESELNVDLAHNEILKYFQGISSNRWLMVKVFLTLIAFFLVFVVFFA